MAYSNPPPAKIAVLTHPTLQDAVFEGEQVSDLLRQHGINVDQGPVQDEALRQHIADGEYDTVIALGGDGTILHAGHFCAAKNTPLMGINMGHFGFLYEIQRDEWRNYIPRLLEGNFRLEKRMMLRAELLHDHQVLGAWDVLNEVIVCRGQIVRPVRLTAHVDGYLLTTYVADGLIASTATGSTGYSLAVNGPILPPELRNILIIPVAPHMSWDRAIVLSEGASVCITVNTGHDAVLSVDGESPIPMMDGDQVHVAVNNHSLSLIRFQNPDYFYRNLTPHLQQNPFTGAVR
ncbi:MAG TPA: NAD(+)/NADH kinase [Anaerolineaceae bacterium]|jgi:NAD+ kinase